MGSQLFTERLYSCDHAALTSEDALFKRLLEKDVQPEDSLFIGAGKDLLPASRFGMSTVEHEHVQQLEATLKASL